MKAIQKFSEEYLTHCRSLSTEQIVQFLEEFRLMHGSQGSRPGSTLISIKIPKPLLSTFKTKCGLMGTPYQTQIKRLMVRWMEGQ